MIVTVALANGFQEAVSQKVFSFLGHIRIQEKQPEKSVLTEETPIIRNDELVKQLKADPAVKTIHPFATKYGILKTKEDLEGVLVKGFDSTYDFKNFQPFLREGRPIQFNDSTYSREIMLSATTAKQLKLKVNDRIRIYFIRPSADSAETMAGVNIRADKLTITGIFNTGIEEYDKNFAIGDLQLIQRLNNWEKEEIGGYEIFLENYNDIVDKEKSLYEYKDFPDTWDTVSVKKISPNIFDWLNMQDVSRNVLIAIMIGVAIMNLITCLIILVLERIRMIGVLKALGASDWTVQKIFLRHSLVITVTGIVIGTLIALALLYLQNETGFIKLKEQAYYLSTAAVKIEWWEIGIICAGTLIVCLLVLLIPTILVRKVQPVRAIHFR